MQRRRADAIGGERTAGHLHTIGGPPAERALAVADVLLGQVEAHVERGHHVYGVRIEADAVEFCRILSGRAAGDGLLGVRVLF